jgi:hypothetical protein
MSRTTPLLSMRQRASAISPLAVARMIGIAAYSIALRISGGEASDSLALVGQDRSGEWVIRSNPQVRQ